MLNMATFAPMAKPSTRIDMIAKPRLRRRLLIAKRASCAKESSHGRPRRARMDSLVWSRPPILMRAWRRGLLGRHAGAEIVFDVELEMRFEFGSEIGVVLIAVRV